MSFSASNTSLWSAFLQLGVIAAALLAANLLCHLPVIRKMLMPSAVLGGFLLLGIRYAGFDLINQEFLEMITYHGIAIGFIALSLRIVDRKERSGADKLAGPKSGALIASCYAIQGIMGLAISLFLAYTFMPELFKASGILLPMGFGQGSGQANNIGSMYEGQGFVGGQSFGLSLAAIGYLAACIVGVVYLNILRRKGLIKRASDSGEIIDEVTVKDFQDEGEIPISESVDKLSIQIAMVLAVYIASYFTIVGLSSLTAGLGEGMSETITALLWGFNFIVGSLVAMAVRSLFKGLRKARIMKRQYSNNYLLSRISGFAFDVIIITGIAAIDVNVLKDLWIPLVLMSIAGTVGTVLYLKWVCKKLYPNYYHEGTLSMCGMMLGTIGSGIVLLRELDPMFDTPAANNLLVGSSAAIIFGAPILPLIAIAPAAPLPVVGILAIYMALLVLFLVKVNVKDKATPPVASDIPLSEGD